jgi:hypothetical protein
MVWMMGVHDDGTKAGVDFLDSTEVNNGYVDKTKREAIKRK